MQPAEPASARDVAASGSLRRRLLFGAAAWIALALLVAGLLIAWLLTTAVERQVYDELEAEVDRLVAALEATPDGRLVVAPRPPDPAFARPYSGRYWQVAPVAAPEAADVEQAEALVRSRSLWDGVLRLPDDVLLDGELHRHAGIGPRERPVVVVERAVVPTGYDRRVRVAVAVERDAVTEITGPVIATLAVSLTVLAAGLIAAAWVQVSAGLRPLGTLRAAVGRIRRGEDERLGGRWPAEVAPLAGELDALLDSNRRLVETARRQAADLAHALKTRLAVVANEAEALAAREPEAAERLTEELTAARRALDRHLSRARAAGGAPGMRARVPAAACVARVADVVARLSDRPVRIERDLDAAAIFLGERADLEEIAGNLLDNASKWARERVRLAVEGGEGRLTLTIEDDGPGIPPAALDRVLQPGVRLDEQAPGSGLGLTIVAEIARGYGGDLRLDASRLGGLRARVVLPAA